VNRLVWLIALLVLLSVGFAPVTVRAFDIPGTGDDSSKKKKKKKDDKKDDTKKDDSSSNNSDSNSNTAKAETKTDSNAETASADGGAADGDNKLANIEAMVESCLLAYNTDDFKTMSPHFSSAIDKNSYKSLFGPSKDQFGKYVQGSKKYVKMASNFKGVAGKVGFNGEFERIKKACIDCTVALQGGKWKIVSLSFGENAYAFGEDAGTGADNNSGVVVKGNTTEIKVPKSLWEPTVKTVDVKVGDFIEYEMPAAPGMKTRMEVLELGDHTMTMLSRQNIPGMGVQESKMKQIFSEPDPESKGQVEQIKKKIETKTFDDKVKIGDKGEFAATRTESYEDGKLIAKTWTCKDVPLGGLVRGEGPDGKAYQQLVNFGRGK
jgi:hypothetical protein